MDLHSLCLSKLIHLERTDEQQPQQVEPGEATTNEQHQESVASIAIDDIEQVNETTASQQNSLLPIDTPYEECKNYFYGLQKSHFNWTDERFLTESQEKTVVRGDAKWTFLKTGRIAVRNAAKFSFDVYLDEMRLVDSWRKRVQFLIYRHFIDTCQTTRYELRTHGAGK